MDEETIARFWSKVEKSDDGSCWPWNAGRTWNGYGRFLYLGKTRRAHRMSWLIHFGPVDDDVLVCHRCDNPPCVNPAHLFIGSTLDNVRDKISKGRHVNGMDVHPEAALKGSAHPFAKLTDEIVFSIRRRYASGESQDAIARSVGVVQTQISRIVLRKSWRHLP